MESFHHFRRVNPENSVHEFRISMMMSHLIAGNQFTHSGQLMIAVLFCQLSYSVMGNISCQLLETGKHEIFIRVSVRTWVKTIIEQVVGRYFHFFHVYSAR